MARPKRPQEITVLSWGKFNGRSDVKHPTWFKLHHSIAFDPEFKHLTGDEMWVFIYLLCMCSLKNKETLCITNETISVDARVPKETVVQSIQKLIALNTLRVRYADVTYVVRARTARQEKKREEEKREEKRRGDADASAQSNPLAEIWNEHRGGLSPVRGCTGKRKASADERWRENPDREYWSEVVKRIAQSDFCCGKKNTPGDHQNWKASFDFLIRPDTHFKVLEGKYDNPAPPRQPKLKTLADLDAEQEEMFSEPA